MCPVIPDNARIPSRIPLEMLRSLREVDTPGERLDDEDLRRSLPRRLGLSNVVETQIRRYAEMSTRKQPLRAREVADLFQLIGRRPDAHEIFGATGRRLAVQSMREGRAPDALAANLLPGALRPVVALRRARRLARDLAPGATVRSERKPPTLIVEGCLPAASCESSAACRLLGEAFRTFLTLSGVGGGEIVHPMCEARGDSSCVWRIGG